MIDLAHEGMRIINEQLVNWCVAACPNEGWARTIFGEPDVERLWELVAYCIRLDEPGTPAQGAWDLEVEVPHLVYEILEIDRERVWEFSIHRGSIHVLPGGDA